MNGDDVNRTDLADRSQRRRKLRDIALALPMFGVFLYFSPILGSIPSGKLFLGIPLAYLLVYGFWAVLILGAVLLARRLASDDG